MTRLVALVLPAAVAAAVLAQPAGSIVEPREAFDRARSNGARVEELLGRAKRVLHAWLRHADPQTLLLPDHLPSFQGAGRRLQYTPHNSGADNYPYLIVTAWFTDRALYDGRMRDMLRNEIRYTNDAHGLPRT